jgi:hypothetical protein
MSTNSTDYKTPYDCPVVSARVTVTWRSVVLPAGPMPTEQANVMLGCSGNPLCGKFPHPIDFTSRISRSCPFHDRLIGATGVTGATGSG